MSQSDQNLEKTLQQLHEEGIAAGVETSVRDGMQIWVGDEVGKRETTRLEPVTTTAGRRWIDSHAAARWLAETAARLFPASRFARRLQLARLTGRR